MAQSPAHKFGQLIGNLLESIMMPTLQEFCDNHGLFLDFQGKKRSARRGKKVSWKDDYGNAHDLDFVIEKRGHDKELGDPIAFIEVAWRRYTKHSRNKAQEIQGAIRPLAEKYKWNNPFLGVVLAGEFTGGSIEQLESLGFNVLYFPYRTIVKAFASVNVDIEFDESTPDEIFQKSIDIIENLHVDALEKIKIYLLEVHKEEFRIFFEALKLRLDRLIDNIILIPLYGRSNTFYSLDNVVDFLDGYSVYEGSGEFRKYEIIVTFTNRDKVEGSFREKQRLKEFLRFIALQ